MVINYNSDKKCYYADDDTPLTLEHYSKYLEEATSLKKSEDTILSQLSIKDLDFDYYDSCLVNYCHQRLNLDLPHNKTCWVTKCENVISLGPCPFSDDNIRLIYPQWLNTGFVSIVVRRFVLKKLLTDGEWSFIRYLPPLDFSLRGFLSRIKYSAFTRWGIRNRDRVLDVVQSISKYGWSNSLACTPHPSVVVFHRSTGKYSVLTGRHRVAAVKYLSMNNAVPGDLTINAVLISVPWGGYRTSRPIPGVSRCVDC